MHIINYNQYIILISYLPIQSWISSSVNALDLNEELFYNFITSNIACCSGAD